MRTEDIPRSKFHTESKRVVCGHRLDGKKVRELLRLVGKRIIDTHEAANEGLVICLHGRKEVNREKKRIPLSFCKRTP